MANDCLPTIPPLKIFPNWLRTGPIEYGIDYDVENRPNNVALNFISIFRPIFDFPIYNENRFAWIGHFPIQTRSAKNNDGVDFRFLSANRFIDCVPRIGFPSSTLTTVTIKQSTPLMPKTPSTDHSDFPTEVAGRLHRFDNADSRVIGSPARNYAAKRFSPPNVLIEIKGYRAPCSDSLDMVRN